MAVHLLVVLALLQQKTVPKLATSDNTIKARLWTMPKVAAPLPPEPAEPEVENTQAPQMQAPPDVPDIVQETAVQSLTAAETPTLAEEPEPAQIVSPPPEPVVAEAPSQKSEGKVLGGASEHMSMAQRHLRNWQAGQQQQVAEQATREYLEKRANPIGEISDYSHRLSEDEQRIQDLVVEANCDSTGNQIATALLGFAGGMVKCSKPPPVQNFIDERLKRNNAK
ncbi:hypothetical protein [Bowmanella denitrificans]|uniref:hypothetical protein n=1 Tax=Bowmanella denitrificans TaxID=366582 RepID=UPI000C9ABCDC|nr:hypothetical protein [Bowmanella denitrificans]